MNPVCNLPVKTNAIDSVAHLVVHRVCIRSRRLQVMWQADVECLQEAIQKAQDAQVSLGRLILAGNFMHCCDAAMYKSYHVLHLRTHHGVTWYVIQFPQYITGWLDYVTKARDNITKRWRSIQNENNAAWILLLLLTYAWKYNTNLVLVDTEPVWVGKGSIVKKCFAWYRNSPPSAVSRNEVSFINQSIGGLSVAEVSHLRSGSFKKSAKGSTLKSGDAAW